MKTVKYFTLIIFLSTSTILADETLTISNIDTIRDWVKTITTVVLSNGSTWQLENSEALDGGDWSEGDSVAIFVEPNGYLSGKRLIKKEGGKTPLIVTEFTVHNTTSKK